MNKLILISLVIFFAICSKSWAEEDYNNKKQQLINDALKTAGIPECGGSPKVGGQVTWNNCWGSYTWTNGNFYIGAFKNGKKHGFGTQVIISSGTILQGRWVENRCEDCKRIEKEQEERYKEHCEGSPKTIESLSELSTWNNCIGTFKNNSIGQKYTGGFKNGLLHGEGKMFFKDDKVFIGIWENNKIIDGYKTTNSKIRQIELEKEVNYDDAKIMCTEIGYKKGTEKYGECVLDLTE